MLLPAYVYSQTTFTTTNTGGDWDTGTTWIGGSAPSGVTPIAVLNGDVTLNSSNSLMNFTSISLNNGKSLTRGTSGTGSDLTLSNIPTFTVNNGNITVYGDLTITGTTAMTITSGNLDVRGKLTIKNGASLTFNSSGTLKAASFETGGSGGNLTVNAGTMTITGLMEIKTGSTVTTTSGATSSIGQILTSNSSTAKFVNGGTTIVSGQLEYGGVITNSGTLTLGTLVGNGSGGSTFTNNGTLKVTGNTTFTSSSVLQLNPGSAAYMFGNVTINSGGAGGGTEIITVGTNASPPPYADLAIKGNVTLSSGGDIEVQKNGRYANFGTLTASGDGNFQIDNGGQAYFGGNISMTGGADLVNNNTTDPWGFYYNGTYSASGGGTVSSNDGTTAVMNSTNAPFAAWVNGVFNLLPVHLVYFKVSAVGENSISISWATSTEKNLDQFIIEKSSDGKTFNEIITVSGSGDHDALNKYVFDDYEPYHGRNYYRLKSIDFDGYTEYFNTIVATHGAEQKITLYPNPCNGTSIILNANFAPLANDYVSVINNFGLEVYRGAIKDFKNELLFKNGLRAGLYHLIYVTDGQKQQVKFVVE
jgi:hypothetical protein